MSENTAIITFTVYLTAMLLVGAYAWRRTNDLTDYLLGGRRLGRWVAALSAGASDMSGWLLLGLPGYAYASGLESLWLAGGLLAGTYLNWHLIARRLRIYTGLSDDALTLPDYLEKRFDDGSRLLRLASAFFILLFFTFYTSSGLVAGGKLFETTFGLPYDRAVLAGLLTIVIYTLLGGFLAVSWTDVVQAILMAGALLIVPLLAIEYAGGWRHATRALEVNHPMLLDIMNDNTGKPLGIIAIVSLLGWGLGYFGQPHILARFQAINSINAVSGARHIAVTWSALSLAGAVLAGLSGLLVLPESLSGDETEKVFILLIHTLFHPVIASILLAAILAAIMSTADSQLIVSSSVLSEDFYRVFLRPQASRIELLTVGRVGVLLVAGVAYWLALKPDSKVLDLVGYAWAGFGAVFGPVILLSLYWPRMTRNGALAGMLSGGLTVVVWKQLSGGLFDLYELVPGFLISVLAIIGVSLIDPPPATKIGLRHAMVRQHAQEG